MGAPTIRSELSQIPFLVTAGHGEDAAVEGKRVRADTVPRRRPDQNEQIDSEGPVDRWISQTLS